MQQEMAGKNPNQITSPGVRQQNKLNAQQVQKPLGRCTVLEMRSLGNHWKKWASFSQLMHQKNIAIWIFCRKKTPQKPKTKLRWNSYIMQNLEQVKHHETVPIQLWLWCPGDVDWEVWLVWSTPGDMPDRGDMLKRFDKSSGMSAPSNTSLKNASLLLGWRSLLTEGTDSVLEASEMQCTCVTIAHAQDKGWRSGLCTRWCKRWWHSWKERTVKCTGEGESCSGQSEGLGSPAEGAVSLMDTPGGQHKSQASLTAPYPLRHCDTFL